MIEKRSFINIVIKRFRIKKPSESVIVFIQDEQRPAAFGATPSPLSVGPFQKGFFAMMSPPWDPLGQPVALWGAELRGLPSCQPDGPHCSVKAGPLTSLPCSYLGTGQKCNILSVLIHNPTETFLVFRGFLGQSRCLWKVRLTDNI